jgi:hypothetical protein
VPVKGRQDRDKTAFECSTRVDPEDMSIDNGLLVGAVIAIALYVLAALVVPERF